MLTCPQWGAAPPRGKIERAGRPSLIVEHHTDGHAGAVKGPDDSTVAEALRYARELQHDMQVNRGWVDSGHSFLVCRNGLILQGRWGTVRALEQGRMVVSAHCPGQNDQPGIEHEHVEGEELTSLQRAATVHLQAWICALTGIRPTALFGHGHFYPTACPSNLAAAIPGLRLEVAHALTKSRPQRRAHPSPAWLLGRRLETY